MSQPFRHPFTTVLRDAPLDTEAIASEGDALSQRVANAAAEFPAHSFGTQGNKAAFSQETILKAAGRRNNEAVIFLWQLQNIVYLQTKRRFAPESFVFTVNAGTPSLEGKVYVVQMKDPIRCSVRIFHMRKDDKWEYAIDRGGLTLPNPGQEAPAPPSENQQRSLNL